MLKIINSLIVILIHVIILSLIVRNFVFSQFKNIIVNNDPTTSEVHIALNPNNVNELVAGANIDKVFTSNNGGSTWNTANIISKYGVWGDPFILSVYKNNFYYFHLSYSNKSNKTTWLDRIICQKSFDKGQTWETESATGYDDKFPLRDQDKEWGCIDLSNGKYSGNIYLTWTQFDEYSSNKPNDSSNIMFSKSTDSGNSWSISKRINDKSGSCLDGDDATEGASPAVDSEGNLYVVWAYNQKLFFDKSIDGGETWLNNDIVISDQKGGWDYLVSGLQRCNGLPSISVDNSNSVYKGTIYVSWTDQRNGVDNPDVWIIKSVDKGLTWSKPIIVNNDLTKKAQFFSSMTLDQSNGKIHIIFYDRRSSINDATDVYLATSTDGGDNFNNIKISESSFTPDKSIFLGDYIGVTAYKDIIYGIWTRIENNKTSILSVRINQSTNDIVQSGSTDLFFEINSKNIRFEQKVNSLVSINIYDELGRIVCEVCTNKFFAKGFHEIQNREIDKLKGCYFVKVKLGIINKVYKINLNNL